MMDLRHQRGEVEYGGGQAVRGWLTMQRYSETKSASRLGRLNAYRTSSKKFTVKNKMSDLFCADLYAFKVLLY